MAKGNDIEIAMLKQQNEDNMREAQLRISFCQNFMRDIATYLEEGVRDPIALADDIHEALGDERINGTKPEGNEDD